MWEVLCWSRCWLPGMNRTNVRWSTTLRSEFWMVYSRCTISMIYKKWSTTGIIVPDLRRASSFNKKFQCIIEFPEVKKTNVKPIPRLKRLRDSFIFPSTSHDDQASWWIALLALTPLPFFYSLPHSILSTTLLFTAQHCTALHSVFALHWIEELQSLTKEIYEWRFVSRMELHQQK